MSLAKWRRVAALLATAAVASADAHAATINIDFNSSDVASATYVGTAASPDLGTVWNGIGGEGGGDLSANGLIDSTGAATIVGVSIAASNSFYTIAGDQELGGGVYNDLMGDYVYLEQDDAGFATGESQINTQTIFGLVPGGAYDIYLYGQGDNFHDVNQNGFQNSGFTIGSDTRQTTWDETAGGDGTLAENVEYVLFPGVTANVQGVIEFDWFNPNVNGPQDSVQMVADVDGQPSKFAGMNAIQIDGVFASSIGPLELRINGATGAIALANNDPLIPITLDDYVIQTDQATLDPAGWNSLEKQGVDESVGGDFNADGVVDGADLMQWQRGFGVDFDAADLADWETNFGSSGGVGGGGWDEAGGVGTGLLAEFFLGADAQLGTTLAPGENFDLGLAFDPTVLGDSVSDETLSFSYYDVHAGEVVAGTVVFEAGVAAAAGAVPEPTGWALFILAGVVGGCFEWLRRRGICCHSGGRGMLRYLALWAIAMTTLTVGTARAELTNSYLFGDAATGAGGIIDSVGGMNGTLVDPAGGFVPLGGGLLDLTRNNGANSNQDFFAIDTAATGAYVDLPNNVLSNAALGGDFGKATLEIWATVEENRDGARIADFGYKEGPNNGEDAPTGGAADTQWVALIPQSGSQDFRATTNTAGRAENAIGSQAPLETGIEHHLVLVLDQDETPDFFNGSATLYQNGAQVAQAELAAFPFATSLLDVNAWLGRSQWGDPLFDGLYNEVNIYNHAFELEEVETSFAEGPLPFIGPTIYVDRDSGEATLVNETGLELDLVHYGIASEIGALDPDGWTPIDGWTPDSSTMNALGQSGGDSLSLDATGISLGPVWIRSPFEDLTASFTLAEEDPGQNARVVYLGDPIARSDFDLDGDVDESDYAVFLANAYADITGTSALDAYFLGDIDGDIDVDRDDFRLFKSDFLAAGGDLATLAAVASVPEPATVALLAMAAALGIAVRRRF